MNSQRLKEKIGLGGFIAGTIWVITIVVIIAVPLSVLTAIWISEFAPRKLKEISKPLIDLLAGISSVIYDLCWILVVVPVIRDYIIPFFTDKFPFFSFLSDNFTSFSVLAEGIVLAVMIFPIISIVEKVMGSVPFEMREAFLALGATKWETVKYVVIRKSFPGIIAGVILGLFKGIWRNNGSFDGFQVVPFTKSSNCFLTLLTLCQFLLQILMEK